MKQEVSGFIAGCDTEESARKSIKKYVERESITMQYDYVRHYPGLRYISKIILNS